jgi:hypothetical protein
MGAMVRGMYCMIAKQYSWDKRVRSTVQERVVG